MMTNRSTDAFSKDCYSNAEARLNQQIRCAPKLDEGCPVIDETGTVCGETDSLSIFKEFRKIYEDCLKKLESSPDGNTILKKLSPFTKIVDDLWEQNTMLVEAVEELEQEATCQVTNLQNKLDKSCQKMCEYRNDINSLIEMIRRLKSKVFDSSDLTFYTFCPDCAFGFYKNRSSALKENPTKTPIRKIRCGDNFKSDTPSNEDCLLENALNVYKEENCDVLNESDFSYLKRKPYLLTNSLIPNNNNSRIASKSPEILSDSQMSCDSLSNDDDDRVLLEDRENESLSCINLLNISLNIPNKSMVTKNSCHCDCMQKSTDSCLKFYKQVQSLNKELLEKNDLLAKNRCHIEQLEKDLKTKKECCKNFVKRLKFVTSRKGVCENEIEDDETEDCNDYDPTILEKFMNDCVSDWVRERNSFKAKADIGERQLQLLTSEKNKVMFEKNELGKKLQCMATENERLTKEITREKLEDAAKNQELTKLVETLMAEKAELLEKINDLHENIKELNSKFKETRWALTSEVAEKHDEVQELKRCMTKLEEQLLQADKQLQFKENVIKDLRKEIKHCKKSGRPDLFDVAEELQRKKQSKHDRSSTATFTFSEEERRNMSCASPCQDGPDSGFFSTATLTPEKRKEPRESQDLCLENARLRSQLECLKNSMKMRMKDLRMQQELTKDLEEELDRTKSDLICLQEKFERQERGQKSIKVTSLSDPGLSQKYGTLYCVVNKVEETLKNLSKKHSCGLSECKTIIEEEMERIKSVKNDLEVLEFDKSKNKFKNSDCQSNSSNRTNRFSQNKSISSMAETKESGCRLLHISDIETFRERALTGVATLEEMKEQIDILESTVQKYIEQYPCDCDKTTYNSCKKKLKTLKSEFDDVTDQLCTILQIFNEYDLDECYNDSSTTKE